MTTDKTPADRPELDEFLGPNQCFAHLIPPYDHQAVEDQAAALLPHEGLAEFLDVERPSDP
ncbi:hypothetical protein OG921_24365 [Aldersonia sp. NBC_00410]|uniref:hypothetical protein n=1 Tax=Aldersonia sp. NBC_00410 TaxID=2975954 RepID=UPI00225B5250|nr:hypothetical protein [Aldersonia sp. NBC_00410]MCX5044824.1 hypothetical protein [Aldersonia sp. NBC_00410]MCX5046311.1 hypothetical protein [Aldersonia sp. NBC_00410]